MPASAPSVGGNLPDYAKQEIRIAAVLNGGVSLAVWISGVVLELHHLALASRGLGNWKPYKQVLDLLGSTARIDVIAGTSAGGLNGAFLALGQTRRRDLTLLRDLWTDQGSLEALLRPALEKNPPSLLQGDGYFLVKMRDALGQVVASANPELTLSAHGSPTESEPPIELILTGTLWTGRESRFTDDMGVGITERDYDARFRFANNAAPSGAPGDVGDLDDVTDAVLDQLAEAARCTSSFPAAFEPHFVTVDGSETQAGVWPSSAGGANFDHEQYLIDGGVLLNKPIRPALEAIYRQTGDNQVRRVLSYVVPDPGEKAPASKAKPGQSGAPQVPPVPGASDVVLAILTRLRSTDSVSRELAEIRDRNKSAAARRRSRSRLSTALASSQAASETLTSSLWSGYTNDRLNDAATSIGRQIASGQRDPETSWSEREIQDSLLRYTTTAEGFSFVPFSDLDTALTSTGPDWHWGQTTVRRLMDMTTDLFRRALVVAPVGSDIQSQLVAARGQMEQLLLNIQDDNDSLYRFWRTCASASSGPAPTGNGTATQLEPIPPRRGAPDSANSSGTNQDELDAWVIRAVVAWDEASPEVDAQSAGQPGGARRARQYEHARDLAAALLANSAQFGAVLHSPNIAADPTEDDQTHVKALYDWLLVGAESREEVLRRMLRLEVVLYATSGAFAHEEQEVELVQMSCSDPTSVTGMQFHHFGAFYRAPWRVNDWIEGRLDGAMQTMRFVLSPIRLIQLGYTADAVNETLKPRLEAIAVPSGPDSEWLQERWNDQWPDCHAELARALDPTITVALDNVADLLATPLYLQILRDDLATLARTINDELDDAPDGSKAWLASYRAKLADAGQATRPGPESAVLSADQLWELRDQMKLVGQQKIAADFGSDTFARTVSHAATVGVSAIGRPPANGKAKLPAGILKALRGYTALVWVLVSYLTRGSKVGQNVVGVVAAIGGTLIAITLIVPSVPIGITLSGLGLVLAAATASGLRTRGAKQLVVRLGLVLLLVLAGSAWFAYREYDKNNGLHGDLLTLLIKIAVTLGVIAFGWFLATARPSRK